MIEKEKRREREREREIHSRELIRIRVLEHRKRCVRVERAWFTNKPRDRS